MLFCLERKSLRMFDYFIGEVNIEVRPVKVAGMRFLDIQNFPDRSFPEPGKILI